MGVSIEHIGWCGSLCWMLRGGPGHQKPTDPFTWQVTVTRTLFHWRRAHLWGAVEAKDILRQQRTIQGLLWRAGFRSVRWGRMRKGKEFLITRRLRMADPGQHRGS